MTGSVTPNLFDLSGRVAVVIGATSGIGRAIAISLAQHGADVIPTGRRQERVERACEEIEALGRRTLALTSNVAHRGSIDVLRDTVLGQFGRVDILVNAAGFTFRKPTMEVTEEQWIGLMDTNLNGPLRACQSFYEPLRASGRGRIINIASLGSYLGFHEVTAYCASKSALLSLTRSLAVEWAPDGIMVNAIAPGIFPTEMTRHIVEGTPRGQELLLRTPMHRFGKPEEVAGAAVLLASDGASFITGQCIVVDGGYLASGVNS
jgi:NAD(P)-dependent dehydrogenase (short-subunit alcohol dehydrogenase family)